MAARRASPVVQQCMRPLLIAGAWLAMLGYPAGAVAAPAACPVVDDLTICSISDGDTNFVVVGTSHAVSDDGGSLGVAVYAVGEVNHISSQFFVIYIDLYEDEEIEDVYPDFDLVSAEFDDTSNQIIVTYTENSAQIIDGSVTFQLNDSGNTSTVVETATVTSNVSGAISGRIFAVTDWDLNDAFDDDSITVFDGSIPAPGEDTAIQTDGTTTATVAVVTTQPDGFDAAPCCEIETAILEDETIDFTLANRTSQPGPADFESGFSWDFAFAGVGEMISITMQKTITTAGATPTPPTATPPTATPATATPATATPPTATPATATPATATPPIATPPTATPATATPPTATPSTATPPTATPPAATPPTATPATATPSTATPETATPATATPPTATPASATATPPTPTPTPALGGSVAIIDGGSVGITNNLDTLLVEAGNTTTIFAGVPADLSPFSQIWDIRYQNGQPISAAEEIQFLNYLAAGGRMFVMGENASFLTRNTSVLNLIEAAGGGSLTFVTSAGAQTVLPPFDGPNVIADGDVFYLAPGGVTTPGNGQFISVDGSGFGAGVAFGVGELANTPAGILTTIFDINFMEGNVPDSQSLLKNLMTFVGGANLEPALALNPPGTDHTLTATVIGSQGEPLVGVPVTFTVLSGPNAGDEGTFNSDANGMAQFTYTGDGGVGADQIIATAPDLEAEGEFVSDIALKFWDSDCNGNGIADTCDIDEFGFGDICSAVPGAGGSSDVNEDDLPDDCGTVHAPFTDLMAWPEAIQLNSGQNLAYIALQEDGFDIDDIAGREGPDRVTVGHYSPTASECPEGFFADEIALLEDDEILLLGEGGSLGVVPDVDVIVSGGACGAVGVDASDPADLGHIISATVDFGLVEEVAIRDVGEETFIYAVSYFQGLKVFSVDADCDRNSCTLTTHDSIGADPNEGWGAALAIWLEEVVEDDESKTLAYIAATNGLQIVDVSDPDLLVPRGSYPTNPDDIALPEQTDVPQDVVVAGGYAYMPIWIGGLLVIDVSTAAKRDNPTLVQQIDALQDSAFFKVEVSSQTNRIYVTEGLNGLAVFTQNSETDLLERNSQFPIGDASCFDGNDEVSINCYAWAVDEVNELVAVTYGVFETPLDGGYQLITQPEGDGGGGGALAQLGVTPVPEPHALILQGVGVLALAGLARLRRRSEQRRGR